ncbi:hypothetical protein P879_09810 [Paragonimus westermani]|uniref:acid phosphatase n=1 Tax=Paragonimus westermani TaxID=34504 RepID=A0A8T0D7L7_9TREM|nr:hypothetical protein P879_09810 [Paragonimus westermani]
MFAVILLLHALSLRFSTSSEENILTPNRPKLLQIFLLSRHGDRSPIHILPKDPYKDHWVQGYGQLTTYGAEQHMALGKFIRSSYSTFISPTFHKDEAFFRSSGTDRTLMSANSFIRGLYPQQLSHIPPPVYSLPIKYDHLLKMSSDCPKFHKMYLDLMNSKEVNRSIKAFEETIDVLRKEYAELFPTESSPADQIRASWKICDTLGIWAAHQLSFRPSWLTDKVVEQCGRMLDFKHRVRFSTPSLTRFRGGPLIAHVIHLARTRANLEQRTVSSGRLPLVPPFISDLVENVTYRQQLVAYFAHDSTLAAVMSHLKIFNGRKPPLASCLIIELHQAPKPVTSDIADDEEFFVRFLYRNETEPTDTRIHSVWPAACGPFAAAVHSDYLCSLKRLESSLVSTYSIDMASECSAHTKQLLPNVSEDCYYPQLGFLFLLQFGFLVCVIRRVGNPIGFLSAILFLFR